MHTLTVLFGIDPVFAQVLQDLRGFWNLADQAQRDLGVFEAGQIISRKSLFGDGKRYAVFAVQTRFHGIEWFVADSETPDRDGRSG